MATDSPSNLNATGFNRTLLRTVEQEGGSMRQLARMATGDLYREEGVYPRITGGGRPTKKTTRAAVTPNSEANYSNRRVRRSDFHDGTTLERGDLDRMVVNPKNDKWNIILNKFKREEDFIFQAAALGSAAGGTLGETATPFDTGNIIPVTLGAASGVTNAGFTYEKLKRTVRTFGINNVNLGSSKPCIVLGWEQWDDMMGQDKFINRDFTDRRAVDGGTFMYIPDYMGCQFIITNIVPYMNTAGTGFNIDMDSDISGDVWTDTDSTDVRACFATTKDATLFEIKPDILTRSGENPMLSYTEQLYVEMGLGAVRMEEEKVIAIPCDQSPA